MDLPIIQGEQIKNAVNSTKLSSSRGSDGFSTLDLRKLPMVLFNMMAIIFQHIELCGKWPSRWILAKTICLPKSAQAKNPFDIRPVTVMAKMYRLWGKIRGKQVAQILAATIPPEIGGPCKGVAADMVALWTSHKIERSFLEQHKLAGVVIDIGRSPPPPPPPHMQGRSVSRCKRNSLLCLCGTGLCCCCLLFVVCCFVFLVSCFLFVVSCFLFVVCGLLLLLLLLLW